MTEPDATVTEDMIYGGRVRVRQPRHGYRVNIDTVLLAATLPAYSAEDGTIVELGCGVGAGLLIVAVNHVGKSVARCVGIERDPAAAALARENVALNNLGHCVEVVEGDALSPPEGLTSVERVFFNPPYDYAGEGRPPAESRRAAYIADRPLVEWVKVWCNRIGSYGTMTLIQRPQRLPEILDALQGRLGGVEIFPIRPFASAPARRIIVRARKGSRAPLQLWGGLDLHPEGSTKDKYTPEAEAILRGEKACWHP